MDLALVLFRVTLIMALLVLCGIFAAKKNILDLSMAKGICNLLLVIVMPGMIIHTLLIQENNPEVLGRFFIAIAISAVYYILCIVVSSLLIPKREDGDKKYKVERLAAVHSNCGFMGFPLLLAAMGEESLIYGIGFNVVFNLINWTWSVALLCGKENLSWRKVVLNPGVISVAVGVALFLLPIPIPGFLVDFTGHLYHMNTPLAMISVGVFIAQIKPLSVFNDPRIYRAALIRNFLLPGLLILLLFATRAGHWFDGSKQVAMSVVICASCASALTSIQFPARFGGDSIHGSRLVALSTGLTLVSLPLVAYAAQWLL